MYQPCCLLPCCQGKPGELAKNYYPNLRNSSFCPLVHTADAAHQIEEGVGRVGLPGAGAEGLVPGAVRLLHARLGAEAGAAVGALAVEARPRRAAVPARQHDVRVVGQSGGGLRYWVTK